MKAAPLSGGFSASVRARPFKCMNFCSRVKNNIEKNWLLQYSEQQADQVSEDEKWGGLLYLLNDLMSKHTDNYGNIPARGFG